MASRAPGVPGRKLRYRPVVPLPSALSEHLKIYLDEQLFHDALILLSDVIIAGASHPNHLSLPTYMPHPLMLEIVSSLLVHPRHTSQAPKKERIDLPSRTITLLRSILNIVGPLNANFKQVFSLKPREFGGRVSRRGAIADSGSDDEDSVKGMLGNEGRMINNAKDFWHIVGWAFNCSVVYPNRWKYWKVWLDFVLDVLDADWEERTQQDNNAVAKGLKGDAKKSKEINVRSSIIVEYFIGVNGRSAAVKRVVASVFTDGGALDLKAYPEVYPDEVSNWRPKTGSKQDRMSNFRNRHADDSDDEEDEDLEYEFSTLAENDLPSSENSETMEDGDAVPDQWLGGSESVVLRQRMITQLSRVAFYLPDCFVSHRELYPLLVDNIKQLPTASFSLLISAADSSVLEPAVYVSLLQTLLLRYVPPNTPHPRSIYPEAGRNDSMNQNVLEACYLPFAASTSSIEDNAKFSLLVENAFRLFLKTENSLRATPELREAVNKGILARESKVKVKSRSGKFASKKPDQNDMLWLKNSGQRLRTLLDLLEQSN